MLPGLPAAPPEGTWTFPACSISLFEMPALKGTPMGLPGSFTASQSTQGTQRRTRLHRPLSTVCEKRYPRAMDVASPE